MSLSELAPISNRLSWMPMRLPASATSPHTHAPRLTPPRAGAHPGGHPLAERAPGHALSVPLEVGWVVVQAMNKVALLRPTGNIDPPPVHDPQEEEHTYDPRSRG